MVRFTQVYQEKFSSVGGVMTLDLTQDEITVLKLMIMAHFNSAEGLSAAAINSGPSVAEQLLVKFESALNGMPSANESEVDSTKSL
jgi:hypothetical protein